MSKVGPKEAALRAQREARVEANKRLIDTELKSVSAKPKRSAETHKKIKADIEAAAKARRK